MDLGIAGKRALVCGASKGLGYGCAQALGAEGAHVVIAARSADGVADAVVRLRQTSSGMVEGVAADITTEEGRARALAAAGAIDILITNAGGPPPGDFRQFGREDWIRALDANMLTPIELMKATVDGMMARRFGRIVNITSSAVKAPIEILGLSNGARAGLTGFVAGLARKTVAKNVTINNLLPGYFDTERQRSNIEVLAKNWGVSVDEARARRIATIPAGRLGNIEEFGAACAYLCSAHAEFITGQNFLIDGGAYPGTF